MLGKLLRFRISPGDQTSDKVINYGVGDLKFYILLIFFNQCTHM